MSLTKLIEAVGIDQGDKEDTAVAMVNIHENGFQEIMWVKHGEEAAAILRALEQEGR